MPHANKCFKLGQRKSGILLFICSLGLMELILQLLSWSIPDVSRVLSGPWDRNQEVVSDVRLRLRGNPLHPDNDEAGYRNRKRLAQPDIVTLGDSQTYGLFVPREQAWPHILAVETRRTVYNMAVDGYGPGQYFLQLDEVLSLKPSRLVLAFYFGNDLFDAFAFSTRQPQLTGGANPELRQIADRLENERPIQSDFDRAFGLDGKQTQTKTDQTSSVRLWVSKNVRLYGFVRALKHGLFQPTRVPVLSKNFEKSASSLSSIQKRYFSVFKGPTWQTILTGGYRALVVDDRDPRIRVGFEVTERLLDLIAERCRTADVNFLVMLLPTKENVFWPHVPDPDNHTGLRQLVMNEERLKKKLISNLREHSIDFIDVLEPLRKMLAQPYFEDADGHPNAAGHQVIALALAAHLAKSEALTVRRGP